MTVDCQWIQKNLEALFCDTLSPEESGMARAHIESCGSCGKEMAALHSIDPLVKRYFQRELDRALRAPAIRARPLRKGRLAGFASAALVMASLLVFVALRTPQQNPVIPTASVAQEAASPALPELAPPVKDSDGANVERSKPIESTPADRPQAISALTTNAPEFLVTDPAGYSHSLDDYRGHVLLIGVWSTNQSAAISNLERLYKAFGSNPKFRFLGVSNEHQAKPANTTFPIVYNQGSRLFGAMSGEFVLLDPMGSIQLRGSLVKDFEGLRKKLATD